MLQNVITGLVAPKGSGKSFFLMGEIAKRDRVLVIHLKRDPVYDALLTIEGSPRELFGQIKKGGDRFRLVYIPSFTRPRNNYIEAPGVDLVLDLAFKHLKNFTVVIDEAHALCTPQNLPGAMMMLFKLGRLSAIDLFWVSHSFAGVHNVLKENTDVFHFWQIISPADLDGIRARFGEQAAERVRALKPLREEGGKVIAGKMASCTKKEGLLG